MKKFIAIILCLVLCTTMLAGCGETNTSTEDNELKIVTTIFPIYDWTRNILGDQDESEIVMLINNGVDLHSYQPTVADMNEIYTCDIFIYVGGESDSWVENLIASGSLDGVEIINLIEVLGDAVVYEELIEGMQETEHDHDHDDDEEHDHDDEEEHDHDEEEHVHDENCDHDEEEHVHDEDCDHDEEEHVHDEDCDHDDEEHVHDEDCDHDHDEEYDEHVWLSLQNAQVICTAITEKLAAIDTANASAYRANLSSYIKSLQELDSEYTQMVASSTRDTLLFADRFPFRYLVDDYNLNYYAAFVGCSSETEASFETIAFLAGKVDELGLDTVLTIEGVTHKIAETVVSTSQDKDQTILSVDSMQAVTTAQVQAGATYLEIMKTNLEVLKIALN